MSLRPLDIGPHVQLIRPAQAGKRRFGVPPGGAIEPKLLTTLSGNAQVWEVFALASQQLEALEAGWVVLLGLPQPATLDSVQISFHQPIKVHTHQMVKVEPVALGCVYMVAFTTAEPTTLPPAPSQPTSLSYWPEAVNQPLHCIAKHIRSRAGFRFSCETNLALSAQTSRPVTVGSIQCTPNNELIIIGPDGPVIGGYPVVGTLAIQDRGEIANIPVGAAIELVPMTR